MSRAARFRKSDAERALRAAVAAGQKVCGYRIQPDGTIEVLFGNAGVAGSNSFDAIMGAEP